MKALLGAVAPVVLVASIADAQQAATPQVIAPGDNLVVDGIPPIPAALAEEVWRYTEVRTATLADWHPTRREMLISTRFGDVAQIHHVAMPGGARRQLTFFPDRVSAAAYQPTRGDSFIFSKDVGGGEWYQIFRQDLATGEVTLLTDGKSRNTGAEWNEQGTLVAFGSTRRTGRDNDIYVMDPRDPGSTRLLLEVEGGGWFVGDWSPDGSRLVVIEYVSINESYLWLVDVATGEKKLLTPRTGEKIAWSNPVFAKPGNGLWVTTDEDSEFQRLAFLDLASGQVTFHLEDLRWDIDELARSHDGRRLALIVNQDGVSVLKLFDTRARKELPVKARLPVGVIFSPTWHRNNRDLAFTMNHARSPSDVYSLDVKTGKLDRWTQSETGGINTAVLPEAELVKWRTFDGRTLSGFLYRPPARHTGKRPVVVSIHGGPEGQARPVFLGRYNYFLNDLGVALILPNVRGSSGYGKTFVALDNGLRREDTHKDIEALLRWIKTRPDLDGDRILVTGGSYGGYMTLATATSYDELICCSISVVGIANLVTFLERTEAYRRDLRRAEYGDERDPKIREFLLRTAPINKVKNVTRPMFIVQGANDPRVPRYEAEQMVAALKKAGTPVWFLMAKDEGHGFAKKQNQDFQFYATILFIREHLLGKGG